MKRTDGAKMAWSDRDRTAARLLALVVPGLVGWLLPAPNALAAELSAKDSRMRRNGVGEVIVSGAIDAESTYAVTIMVEIVPRPGNTGIVEFTRAIGKLPAQRSQVSVHHRAGRPDEVRVTKARRPDVDVVQIGDPWPNRGTFSPFDTDETTAATLNGSIDDNGTFIGEPTGFSGALSVFPVRARSGAQGVWDVTLSTSRGDSSWEGVVTTLVGGTITVTREACSTDGHCRDKDPCTIDTCEAGTCEHMRVDGPCTSEKPSRKRLRRQRP